MEVLLQAHQTMVFLGALVVVVAAILKQVLSHLFQGAAALPDKAIMGVRVQSLKAGPSATVAAVVDVAVAAAMPLLPLAEEEAVEAAQTTHFALVQMKLGTAAAVEAQLPVAGEVAGQVVAETGVARLQMAQPIEVAGVAEPLPRTRALAAPASSLLDTGLRNGSLCKN